MQRCEGTKGRRDIPPLPAPPRYGVPCEACGGLAGLQGAGRKVPQGASPGAGAPSPAWLAGASAGRPAGRACGTPAGRPGGSALGGRWCCCRGCLPHWRGAERRNVQLLTRAEAWEPRRGQPSPRTPVAVPALAARGASAPPALARARPGSQVRGRAGGRGAEGGGQAHRDRDSSRRRGPRPCRGRSGAGVPGSRGLAQPGAAREVRADPTQKLAPGRAGRSRGVSGRLGQPCGAAGSPPSLPGRQSAGLAGGDPSVSREARRESPKSAQGAGRFPAEVFAGEESPLTSAFLPAGPGARIPPRATAPALRRERGARALPHFEGPPSLPRAPGAAPLPTRWRLGFLGPGKCTRPGGKG